MCPDRRRAKTYDSRLTKHEFSSTAGVEDRRQSLSPTVRPAAVATVGIPDLNSSLERDEATGMKKETNDG
jgi:hypothetical protein